MGNEPMNWEGAGRIPPQGGLQADGGAALARGGRLVDIPPTEGRNGRGGAAGGGDLLLPPL